MRLRPHIVLALVALFIVAAALPLRAQKGPIKIGLVTPLTGGMAPNGKDTENGLRLFLEEQAYKIAGREVKLYAEDDEGKPATGLTKARALVEGQGVHLLFGPVSAAVGYAIAPYVDGKKVPTVYAIVAGEDITQRKRSPWIVRTGWASAQPSHPFGEYAYKTLGYKRIAMIGYDFAFGWEVAGGFQRTFEEAGGQVVQKLWPPLFNPDYAPFITQLRGDVDAIYAVFSGGDALRFARQFADSPLKGKIPVIAGGVYTDEHVLRTMGDEVLGVVSALHYSAALDNPANRKFVTAYQAKFGTVPSYYSEGPYVTGYAVKAAIESIGGDVENAEKLITAIRKVEMAQSPRGPIRFDEYGNPIQNIYVRKVERVNGKLQNTVVHTFPAVSQFWRYKPDEFLKKPVYARDFPVCKHCQ
jgi:branched-chain amino acid transport system substrate-binding protein